MEQILLVDFFVGCGGMSAGMVASGMFDLLCGVDIDAVKLSMLAANFPHATILNWELECDNDSFEDDPIPSDAKDMLDAIVRLAIDRYSSQKKKDLKAWEASCKRGGYKYPQHLPKIHMHGSPSCVDFSKAKTRGTGVQSSNTMRWYSGFITFLREKGFEHTMSMEEAYEVSSNLERKTPYTDKGKEKQRRVAHSTIVELLEGVKRRDDYRQEFDPEQTYYYVVDYEECGLPARGRRTFVCHGWDPLLLRESVGHQNDACVVFGNHRRTFDQRYAVPQRRKRPTTTMWEAFKLAKAEKVAGATRWLKDVQKGIITHQINASANNMWYGKENAAGTTEFYTFDTTRRYAGMLDKDGRPFVWVNSNSMKTHAFGWLKKALRDKKIPKNDNVSSDRGKKFVHNATVARLADVKTTSSYRPVRTFPAFWAKQYDAVKRINARAFNTRGNSYGWPNNLSVDINTKLVRRFTPSEGRILMTFPGDWVFYCGDECTNRLGEASCKLDLPDKAHCLSTSNIKQCCDEVGNDGKSPPGLFDAFKDNGKSISTSPDERCYGDAVPPLAAFRVAAAIIDSTHMYCSDVGEPKARVATSSDNFIDSQGSVRLKGELLWYSKYHKGTWKRVYKKYKRLQTGSLATYKSRKRGTRFGTVTAINEDGSVEFTFSKGISVDDDDSDSDEDSDEDIIDSDYDDSDSDYEDSDSEDEVVEKDDWTITFSSIASATRYLVPATNKGTPSILYRQYCTPHPDYFGEPATTTKNHVREELKRVCKEYFGVVLTPAVFNDLWESSRADKFRDTVMNFWEACNKRFSLRGGARANRNRALIYIPHEMTYFRKKYSDQYVKTCQLKPEKQATQIMKYMFNFNLNIRKQTNHPHMSAWITQFRKFLSHDVSERTNKVRTDVYQTQLIRDIKTFSFENGGVFTPQALKTLLDQHRWKEGGRGTILEAAFWLIPKFLEEYADRMDPVVVFSAMGLDHEGIANDEDEESGRWGVVEKFLTTRAKSRDLLMKDLCATMGFTTRAQDVHTTEEKESIRRENNKIYRRLAREYHPDRTTNDTEKVKKQKARLWGRLRKCKETFDK